MVVQLTSSISVTILGIVVAFVFAHATHVVSQNEFSGRLICPISHGCMFVYTSPSRGQHLSSSPCSSSSSSFSSSVGSSTSITGGEYAFGSTIISFVQVVVEENHLLSNTISTCAISTDAPSPSGRVCVH